MKKYKTVHTTHVPSPQSGHGVTNLPELQCLRRLRFAAQTHHGRTRNWERSSFTGKGQDWKPDSACRARNSKAPEWRAPLPDSTSNCCTRPGAGATLQESRGSVRTLHPPCKSPGHTHHFLLPMHPGVLPSEPQWAKQVPGKLKHSSPPFSYPELKYGGKGATVHYP